MKLTIKNTQNTSLGTIDLPTQFNEPVRTDLIRRAVESLQSKRRQPYGADPRAGLEYSADLSRRRKHYRGSYGKGISRVPRKIMSRSGTQFNWVGAEMPGTVGGRRAHPPKAWKIFAKLLNRKENQKAIRSAISATLNPELSNLRGHNVPKDYPFALDSDFESLNKTKDMVDSLQKIGLTDDLSRAKPTQVRAGIGKMRGRKIKRATSALLVFSKDSDALKAANNIPGVQAVRVDELNAELLAPGTHAGRITLFTKDAITRMKEEKLYTADRPKKTLDEVPKTIINKVKKVTKKVTKKTVAKEVENADN